MQNPPTPIVIFIIFFASSFLITNITSYFEEYTANVCCYIADKLRILLMNTYLVSENNMKMHASSQSQTIWYESNLGMLLNFEHRQMSIYQIIFCWRWALIPLTVIVVTFMEIFSGFWIYKQTKVCVSYKQNICSVACFTQMKTLCT